MLLVSETRVFAGVAAAMAFAACISGAAAGELIYQPVNPAFGGHPNNAAWLNQNADVHNNFKRKKDRIEKLQSEKDSTFKRDPIADFSASLQSRLLSELSDKIVTAIYGTDKQNSGTFIAGSSTVSFVRNNGTVLLTISDGIKTTQIALPE
ncbi:MAG: curli assembly protein CsgF [Beijerinckiaceae bacterium]